MKMRDYVDEIQGEGSWDNMHDLINRMEIPGWDMPPVEVDGAMFNIFPGTNREVTLEAVQDEVRRALASIAAGDYEEHFTIKRGEHRNQPHD